MEGAQHHTEQWPTPNVTLRSVENTLRHAHCSGIQKVPFKSPSIQSCWITEKNAVTIQSLSKSIMQFVTLFSQKCQTTYMVKQVPSEVQEIHVLKTNWAGQ